MTGPRALRLFEYAAIFLGGPALLALCFTRPPVIPALWVGALISAVFLRRRRSEVLRGTVGARDWALTTVRFLGFAAALTAIVAILAPERLFIFVREHPLHWAALMVGYPLASVIPQGVIYRSLFVERYAGLFRASTSIVGGLTFGLGHAVFRNWIAVGLTIVGGVIFCRTYLRTRSFALATFEHALYGCFVFSVGLGDYLDSQSVG